jgi:Cu/Ag efflux pump CusA
MLISTHFRMSETSPATRILPLHAALWTSHQIARNFYPRIRKITLWTRYAEMPETSADETRLPDCLMSRLTPIGEMVM